MSLSALATETPLPRRRSVHLPAALFGSGLGLLTVYLFSYAIDLHHLNDFYREAWPAYRLLLHGHFVAFLRASPAYVGSLLLRAPFALLAGAFGPSAHGVYVATAIPCLLAPGLLAGYLAAQPRIASARSREVRRRGLRPVDLFMLTPPAMIAVAGGHPEDVLGGVLCVLAVLLACRGSGRAAGLVLALALVNKSWALVAVPLVVALLPANRRLAGIVTLVAVTGIVMVPVTAVRLSSTGSLGATLGDQTYKIFLTPQLLWWFGRNSWVVREAHILLVLVDWLVTGCWWYLRARGSKRRPSVRDALAILALVLFLRAALDPWDNGYYLTPFMLAVTVYEDPPGFPKLTWLFAIAIPVIVPPFGALHNLGANGRAAVFTAFALITIAWFGRLAFNPRRPPDAAAQAAATGSPS